MGNHFLGNNMNNKLYNSDGTIKAENISRKEWLHHIQACSVVACDSDHELGEIIKWFMQGKSSHIEIYLGHGKNMVASAEAEGFRLKRLYRNFSDLKVHIRIYAKRNLTVEEAEKVKGKCWELLCDDKGYDFLAVPRKAIYGIIERLNDWLGTEIPKPKWADLDDPDRAVCNERVMEAFGAIDVKIVASSVAYEESAPRDVNNYMESDEAKNEGWYVAAEWNC